MTKYKLLRAAAFIRKTIRVEIGTSIADIPVGDMQVLKRYLDLGVLKFTTKKINYSREIYFPTIESKYLEEATVDFWRVCVRQFLQGVGHSVNLSKASAADYMSKAWKYQIEPTVLKRSEASLTQKKLEKEVLQCLFDTEGGY